MHELPLTEQIITIASEKASEHQAQKVLRIALVVGELSGFVGESIQMYFDVISKGTLCEGAILEIETIEAKWYCPSCDCHYVREPLSFACPHCAKDGLPTDLGKEFYVKHIEIDT
ncbi:hydrogenase maturation nickel metallochaperone HypA [Dehalobacter sp. DCM]|uniref:hydrogenase maturation nickel metallochaperone HypA n=1 Tax=Dehalobacter sp. DCM TaxID=2907827 RepID=UPI003081FB2B|nr:hydrogenase maturation nickel metallochaperone HypA [Dehalobacter sp. DCM]